MVVDFSDLKYAMKNVIGEYDHALLLHDQDTAAEVLSSMAATNGSAQNVVILPFNPTAENLAKHAGERLQSWVNSHFEHFSIKNVYTITRVTVCETESSCATWTPGDTHNQAQA